MWRFRIANGLRLLSALALFTLLLLLFSPPLVQLLGPQLGIQGLPELLPRALLPGTARPSRGFIITARPAPSGAILWVDGRTRGRTPVVANVSCREGAEVELRLTADRHQPWVRRVQCRQGGALLIKPKLNRVP
jgi:hypothetical protein